MQLVSLPQLTGRAGGTRLDGPTGAAREPAEAHPALFQQAWTTGYRGGLAESEKTGHDGRDGGRQEEGAGGGWDGNAVVAAPNWTPPSWEDIVRTHSGRVYRLAYRLTGNTQDAEDLTQEVFVRVFRSLSKYTPGTFEGWLHRITTNLFLDMARRRQRIRFEGLGDDAAQRLHGPGPTPAEAFEERHLDADVSRRARRRSHRNTGQRWSCVTSKGLSYEEIAATLGVKLGTVRSRIHRGRAHLRAALDHRRPPGPESGEPARQISQSRSRSHESPGRSPVRARRR